jgi:hypothetical protein
VAQIDVKVVQTDVQVTQSDVQVAQIYVQVAQNDMQVAHISPVARISSAWGCSFIRGAADEKRKLLGLQMVMGLRFGAGTATSGAGAGAPVAPALATGLLRYRFGSQWQSVLGVQEAMLSIKMRVRKRSPIFPNLP